MTNDEYETAAFQFEQMAIEYGLVISRRFPGEWGYEYRLSLPGEDLEYGTLWHFLLDERMAVRYSAAGVTRQQVAYIAERLLAKRMAA